MRPEIEIGIQNGILIGQSPNHSFEMGRLKRECEDPSGFGLRGTPTARGRQCRMSKERTRGK